MRFFTNISHRIIDSEPNKADNVRTNVTLSDIHLITVAVEKQ